MDIPFDLNTIELLIVFVFPGLISIQVYRLIMPSRTFDFGTITLLGLFYTSLNFGILFPLIYWVNKSTIFHEYSFAYFVGVFVILIAGPVSWPFIFRKILQSKRYARTFQIPYPTAWDYFFDQRRLVFLLFHLKNDKLVGGYFGPRSFACAYPNDGDVYIETLYYISTLGKLEKPIPGSRGMLIRKDSYLFIEIFDIPKKEEDINE